MDIDKLRPEVRDALDVVADDARCVCSEAYTSRNMKGPACNHDTLPYIETIHTELVRLASRNAELEAYADDMASQATLGLSHRLNQAEAELAALKARIAEAPVVACPKTLVHAGNTMQTEFLEYTHERMPGGCNSWAGKRVRLVVEE